MEQKEQKEQTQQPQAKKEVMRYENISEQVLAKIGAFEQEGGINLPKNYSVANALKSAWLVLQETKDRTGKKALEVCTKTSIANALLKMAVQGLSVAKEQVYFIVYGNELVCQRSYFGSVALAERTGKIKTDPVANVIYEGDDFVYTIDPNTGLTHIVKHEQKFDNINNSKIKGAYAIVQLENGQNQVTVMTIDQIHASWNQGATKGASPAHKNFPEEMCKKSVIGRACKLVINSSGDSYLYEDDTDTTDAPKAQRDAEVRQRFGGVKEIDADDVPFEEEKNVHEEKNNEEDQPENKNPQEGKIKNEEQNMFAGNGPGY